MRQLPHETDPMPMIGRTVAIAACIVAACVIVGCGPSAPPAPPMPLPATPPVVESPPPAPQIPPAPPPPPPAVVVIPDMSLPPGPIYRCDVGGDATPIEFVPKVEALCRRHPEMGPCQFERDACRARGGRVYTAAGAEVTTAVEAKYDERVRRVRFQGDGGAPSKAP